MICIFLISEMLNGFRICQRGTFTMVHELMIIHTNTQKRLPLFRLVLNKKLEAKQYRCLWVLIWQTKKKQRLLFYIYTSLYINMMLNLIIKIILKRQTGYARLLSWVCSVVDKFFRIHLRHIKRFPDV